MHRIVVQWFITVFLIKIIIDTILQYALMFDSIFTGEDVWWGRGGDLKLIKTREINKLRDIA